MLTVIVGLDWSGNSSTRSPFARRYSVMPSTSVTFTGVAGTAAGGFVAGCAALTTAEKTMQASRTVRVPVFSISFPFPDLALHLVQIGVEFCDAGKDTTGWHGLHDLQHLAYRRLRVDQRHAATCGLDGLASPHETADARAAEILELAQIEHQSCQRDVFRQEPGQLGIQLRRSMRVEPAGERNLRYVALFHHDGQ